MSKTTEEFTGHWKPLFDKHGFSNFDAIWSAELELVDEPNVARGGRSEVGRLNLTTEANEEKTFYVKRQVNYTAKTLAHPLSGIPLTLKEFNNISAFEALNIPCLEACYQGYRNREGELQSILITPELEGYQDLDHYVPASINESRRITRELANVVAKVHNAGFRYGCLYPKHIFVNPANSEAPVRLIDLEKVSKTPLRSQARIKDLTTLQRRVSNNRSCQLYFLLCYFYLNKHNDKIRQFVHQMDDRRSKRKKG